jgi:hypothetical protein
MTQKTEVQVLSYKLSDFIKYRDENQTVPFDLNPYFYNGAVFDRPNLKIYLDQLELVNSSLNGNSSDKVKTFIKTVKFCINTVNKKNYDKCVEELSKLDYTSEENVQILAHELIACGMRCPIAIKGTSRDPNNTTKSISELIADLVKHFSLKITDFKEELLKMCHKIFLEFVNLNKSMDENNESTVDNYKGFMTLFGLLYSNGLIPSKALHECIELIKRTIFNTQVEPSELVSLETQPWHEKMFGHKKKAETALHSTIAYYDTSVVRKRSDDNNSTNQDNRILCYRKGVECSNYHKGYEFLMNNVISTLDAKIRELKCDTSNTENTNLLKKIHEYIECFIRLNDEIECLNKKFRVTGKNQSSCPLKPHVTLTHSEIGEKLKKLLC